MQTQKPNQTVNFLRRRPTSMSLGVTPNTPSLHSKNTSPPQISSPRPEFDDNLVGFSLVPTWLQLVYDQRNQSSQKSYPFPQNHSTAFSTYSSKSNSPLNGSLSFVPQPLNSPSATSLLSSEDEDQQYWKEEDELAFPDGDEQNEDLEVVYRSFRY
jgi:hypothetical protein